MEMRVRQKSLRFDLNIAFTPFGQVGWLDNPEGVEDRKFVAISFPEETGGLQMPNGRRFVTEDSHTARWYYGSGFTISYSGSPIREVKEESKPSSRLKFENEDLTFLSDFIFELVSNRQILVDPVYYDDVIKAYANRESLQKEYAEFREAYEKMKKHHREESARLNKLFGGDWRTPALYPAVTVKTPDIIWY